MDMYCVRIQLHLLLLLLLLLLLSLLLFEISWPKGQLCAAVAVASAISFFAFGKN